MTRFYHSLLLLMALVMLFSMTASVASASPVSQETATSADWTISTQALTIFAVGVSLLSLFLVLFKKPASQWDGSISLHLQMEQQNRANMDRYERMYQEAGTQKQQTLDAALSLLQLAASILPTRADDALVEFLKDIQQPGAPVKPTMTEVDKAIYDPVPPPETVAPLSLGDSTKG